MPALFHSTSKSQPSACLMSYGSVEVEAGDADPVAEAQRLHLLAQRRHLRARHATVAMMLWPFLAMPMAARLAEAGASAGDRESSWWS